MKNDGQKLVNGTYTYNLYLNTNETANPKQKLTVNMKVSDNKPELTSAKMVDFGDLLVGKEKMLSVEIVNKGYGVFGGQYGNMYSNNMSCSSDKFALPSYSPNMAARSTNAIDITFRPTKSGNQSGTVTLTSHDGTIYSFIVRGVASMPAKISIDPMESDLGDLEVGGEAKTTTFTIKNEGEYPLSYVFQKFSSETIEDAETAHKFGYTSISNLNGSDAFAYDGNPELNSETDITAQFNQNNWQSSAIDLGFKFPFYGTEYTKVYVTSHGGVEMQTKEGNITCIVPTADCVEGLGYMLAQKAERVRAGRYMAWLSSMGRIELGLELEQQYGSFGYFMTCVEKEAGQPWIKMLTTETEGEIAVGESKEVTVEVNANSAYFDKDKKAVVVIKSNDPAQPLVNYPIILNRNAAPVVTVPSGTVTVPEGSKAEISIYVGQNTGIITYETLFSDPDGDKMTFSASMPANSFAEIMTNNNGFLISGNAAGNVNLTLKATDAAEAMTSVIIPVIVNNASGIGAVTSDRDINVYPNPVDDRANITLGSAATDVTYYVYDNGGRLITSLVLSLYSNNDVPIVLWHAIIFTILCKKQRYGPMPLSGKMHYFCKVFYIKRCLNETSSAAHRHGKAGPIQQSFQL